MIINGVQELKISAEKYIVFNEFNYFITPDISNKLLLKSSETVSY